LRDERREERREMREKGFKTSLEAFSAFSI
jgi:hypothetical protein